MIRLRSLILALVYHETSIKTGQQLYDQPYSSPTIQGHSLFETLTLTRRREHA